MYQVLIGLMAAAATYATPVAFRPIDTWPAALGIPQATTHDLLDSPSTSERCHLRIETSWMTKHRGTLPDPPTAGYKREPLNQCPLGHGALLGRHSLCSMYQMCGATRMRVSLHPAHHLTLP
uniref:Putative conserved secreted protein ovary overexpressed n=1 Tax=Rhipicephalus microplus TaxID=6941 RepID=A0A6M2D6V0_RHIMP